MESLIGLFVLVFKVIVYVSYFLPVLGARILDAIGLWPEWWPFGGAL